MRHMARRRFVQNGLLNERRYMIGEKLYFQLDSPHHHILTVIPASFLQHNWHLSTDDLERYCQFILL